MTHAAPDLPVGQKIQFYRQRAGKSRAVVGGLVGRSAEWVKAVERGRLLPPRLPMLNKLAAAVNVQVVDLLDHDDPPGELFAGPGHAALPAVRDAVNAFALVPDHEPEPVQHLRARIAAAWRARHASPDHRTVLGTVLPGLIRDAQLAARSYAGRERNDAHAVLADVLGLTQMFAAYQPDSGLLWRVSDRAMVAAQESGDPHAIGGASWFLVEALRDSGDWDAAMRINLEALRAVEPHLADGGDELLAMWGSLQTLAALTAARSGEEGRAWRHWDVAHDVVLRLPVGYHHPHTWFSRPIVGFYALSVATELQKGGEAVRQAGRVAPVDITSRPRRARHLIEVARGYRLKADHESTVRTLREAYTAAPETIRWNGYARQMTLDLADDGRTDARALAADLGLPT